MKLTKTERIILMELFNASNGLFLFTMHRQLNLTPKELFNAIENLKENKLVNLIDDCVIATKEGIDFAIKNTVLNKSKSEDNKTIIDSFLGPRIEINSFYIPIDFNQ